MADYLIHDSTLEDIADAIRAKTGGSSLIEPEDMPTEIASISGGGGTSITDGIVVHSRDGDGFATSVTFYGTVIHDKQFYNRTSGDGGWVRLSSLSFHDTVTEIGDYALNGCGALQSIDFSGLQVCGQYAFQSCSFVSVVLPNATTIGSCAFIGCTSLQTVTETKNKNIVTRMFQGDNGLVSVEVGSIGYGITNVASNAFTQCAQTGLTITLYTTGSYANTAVTNTRTGATNATIIIKASEATTYNGTSYAAGDTILTSEVA